MRIPNPLNGLYTKSASLNTPASCTQYALNVRPVDTQEGQERIGKRPGQAKVHTDQLGSTGQPIVAMCTVAVTENTES